MGGNNDRPVSHDLYGPKEVVPDHRDSEALETIKPLALPTLRTNYLGLSIALIGSLVLWVLICLGLGQIWHWLWQ